MHYLDNSATTFVIKEAADVAYKVMTEAFGNPSSVHKMGIDAERILENSRKMISDALCVKKDEVFFTSGGTESINTALLGAAHKNSRLGKHIISSEVEHAATLNTLKELTSKGFEVTLLKPNVDGSINFDDFKKAYREDTILVSLMMINNETGAGFPINEIGAFLKNKKTVFHVDAVQGFLREKMNVSKMNVDLMSISGHKIGAPKGIGALYIKKGTKIPPFILGGGQEKGQRSGTEPLPNIAAFAEAVRIRNENFEEDFKKVQELRDYLEEKIIKNFDFAKINGKSSVPHVLNVSFLGCKSEVLLRVLGDKGVYVSAGSACSKGKKSHVLSAMGIESNVIDSAIRVSFSPYNKKEDIDAFIDGVKKGAAMLRR